MSTTSRATVECACSSCRLDGAPTEIRGHRYVAVTALDDRDAPLGAPAYRWRCEGPAHAGAAHGQWNYQSDNVAYHHWRGHVTRCLVAADGGRRR